MLAEANLSEKRTNKHTAYIADVKQIGLQFTKLLQKYFEPITILILKCFFKSTNLTPKFAFAY